MDPLTIAVLGSLGLDLGSSLFGESQSDVATAGIKEKYKWTAPGARDMLNLIKPLYESMLKGGEAPDIGLLNKYYEMAKSNLGGQYQGALAQSTGMGMAQGSQMNLSDPYAYANFMGRRATTGFAGQFKDLEAQGMMGKFGANRSMLNQLLGLAPGLIEMGGGGNTGGQQSVEDRLQQAMMLNSRY